jgi:hypothetical protein
MSTRTQSQKDRMMINKNRGNDIVVNPYSTLFKNKDEELKAENQEEAAVADSGSLSPGKSRKTREQRRPRPGYKAMVETMMAAGGGE